MSKEKLSAGLCDTCANCQKTQIGDGVSEPFAVVPFCFARQFEVEPLPKEERIMQCDDYMKDSLRGGETKAKLKEAYEYCNDNDKSTEFMLEYMQDFAGVDLDAVLEFLQAEN